jgi:Gpi18-like mannosyltransferase
MRPGEMTVRPATGKLRGRGLLWRLDTPEGLVAMFAVAFVLRLLIAPHLGFYGDLRLFKIWTGQLADVGTRHFYVKGQFQDYPPGYLYILWLTAKISAAPSYLLLKLPTLVADLALAWLAATIAVRIAPPHVSERWPVRPLVAAAVLFNPAVIALGAGWGQVDAVPAAFVLGSLLLLFTGRLSLQREVGAFLLFAVAVAMKPQSGFVLPVMLYALYRRYLHRRSRPEVIDGTLSIAAVGTPSVVLWGISGLAFGLGPVGLLHFYKHSASVYPVTSANAFNLWGAIGFWRNDSIGDHVLRIAGVSALHVGELALVLGMVYVLWRAHRAIERGASEPLVLMIASATISLLAYTLLTRMHERYMFLALACFGPLVVVRPLRFAYAALSTIFVINLWFPYAYFNSGWHVQALHFQPWFDWVLGGFATDTWQKKVWSIAVTLIALAVTWLGMQWAGRSPATAPAVDAPVERPANVPLRRGEALAAELPTGRYRWGPFALVALACGFGLAALRGETTPVPNLNDSAFHEQMVRWADGAIGQGRVPLDGWFPDLSLGSSFFHHYQSLAETLTAAAARVVGATDDGTYLWILYVLLALWPISVYLGARLLDWDRWTAASAAAVSPLIVSAPGYGLEHGSYTFQGYGVYSQLWAMWLLPLAWGLTWQAVVRGKRYAAAAAALALTIACHFITGYLALLTVGVWVIVVGRSSLLPRIGRAALVAGGSVLIAAWVLVPLIGDTKWTTQSAFYKGSVFNDSYGAGKVLRWLFTGKLFDNGRFPVVTLLVFVGIIVCAERVRRELRARALLGALTLSLFLFFGRATWGRLIDVLPGFHDIQIHRFVTGVHLAGILLAGVGLAWLLRTAYSLSGRLVVRRAALLVPAAVAVCIAVLAPAWIERAKYDERGADYIQAQRATDATDGRDLDRLISIVKAHGDGRVYAGLRGNWGLQYVVGAVPVHAWLADRDVDAIGFTFRTIASLSTDVEAYFDETKLSNYQMFNVRYLILPSDRKPAVPATLLASSGRHRLWRVRTSGYFQVVDRAAPIAANRALLAQAVLGWMRSDLASRGLYPGVTFPGEPAAPPTFAGSTPPHESPGTVVTQSATPQDGVFDATVDARRPAVALLKATYDPRWTATVDGTRAKPTMMAPSLIGVDIPVGKHEVRFYYKAYAHYPLLLAIGGLTLLALAFVPVGQTILHRQRTGI